MTPIRRFRFGFGFVAAAALSATRLDTHLTRQRPGPQNIRRAIILAATAAIGIPCFLIPKKVLWYG